MASSKKAFAPTASGGFAFELRDTAAAIADAGHPDSSDVHPCIVEHAAAPWVSDAVALLDVTGSAVQKPCAVM